MLLFVLLFFLIILLGFWNFVWKRKGLPPGPTPIPFIGNALKLSVPYVQFQEWTREYGPIYTIWIAEDPVVIVTEYELMRELFIKDGDTFAGRHFMAELFKALTASNGQNGGVIRTEGEPWKVLRRWGLQSMRNLGVGRTGLERQFISDISKLIGKLRKEIQEKGDGEEVAQMDLQKHIDRLIGSIINRVLFGYAFDEENIGKFYELKAIMFRNTQLLGSTRGQMLMAKPGLRKWPFFSDTFQLLDQHMGEVFKFVDRPIQARIAERQKRKMEKKEGQEEEEEEPRDLLDYFLNQMELAEEGKGGDDDQKQYFNLVNLRTLCFDLFLAGQETTATTLNFLVLYLLLDQAAQEKMHEELDKLDMENEGGQNGQEKEGDNDEDKGNSIGLADRPKLPYLNAVINESQRMCNLLAMNLSHRTMCDVSILGGKYHLKKGTIIVPQICCVLFDEKIFPDPHRFKPERFLDENGQLKRCDEFIPFSLGKRICMGESLARMELFLFTANFFRHFQVLPVDPLKPPSTEKHGGFAVRLEPYNCRLVLRKRATNK